MADAVLGVGRRIGTRDKSLERVVIGDQAPEGGDLDPEATGHRELESADAATGHADVVPWVGRGPEDWNGGEVKSPASVVLGDQVPEVGIWTQMRRGSGVGWCGDGMQMQFRGWDGGVVLGDSREWGSGPRASGSLAKHR